MTNSLFTVSIAIIFIIQGASSLIGGRLIQPQQFPYLASIWDPARHLCNGAIISVHLILTKKTCIPSADPKNLVVGAGATNSDDPNVQWRSVSNIHVHPGFNSYVDRNHPRILVTENDIAILRLPIPLIVSATVQPILVANTSAVCPCCPCQIAGWDEGDPGGPLKVVTTIIAGPNRCEEMDVYPIHNELCGESLYSDAFVTWRDIGGPTVCDGKLIGIVASRNQRLRDPWLLLPSSPYVSFIEDAVNNNV